MEYLEQNQDGLHSLLSIISRRKGLILLGFFTFFTIAFIGIFFMPSVYEAATLIFVPRFQALDFRGGINVPFRMANIGGSLRDQREIIRSAFFARGVVKKLKLYSEAEPPSLLRVLLNKFYRVNPDPFEDAVNRLRRKVQVQIRSRSLIHISVRSADPKKAADIANALAEIYIDYSNKNRIGIASSARNFIDEQVKIARQKLSQSEKDLLEFKQNEKLLSLNEETTSILENLATTEAQKNQLELEMQALNDRLLLARKTLTEGKFEKIISLELLNNPEFQELKVNLKNLESELSEISRKFKMKYVTRETSILQKRIAETKEKLLKLCRDNIFQMEKELDTLESKKKILVNKIQSYHHSLESLPRKEYELSKIIRAVKTNEEIYLLLLKNLEGTRISEVTERRQLGTVKVFAPAFPPSYPLRRKRAMLAILACIMGSVFGLGMALYAEYKDDSLRDAQQVERYLKVLVVGIIPLTPKKHQRRFLGFGP